MNDKVEKAILLEAEVKKLREEIYQEHQTNLKAKPVAERLIYAAYSCCPCGAGLAYDPCYEDEDSEVVDMAQEKHTLLSAEYFTQKSKFVNMIKERK